MRFILLFFFLVLLSASALATDYHVNNAAGANCSDLNPGTVSQPLCTVQAGVNKGLVSGDIVTIHTGTYNERVALPFTLRATASNPITIRGAPAENRDNIVIDGTGFTEAIYSAGDVGSGGGSSNGSEYLVFQHFHVMAGSNHGIFLDNEHHFVTISDILMDGLNQTGGLTGSQPDSGITIDSGGTDNTIDGVRFMGPSGGQAQVVAMNLISDNTIVRNSYAENIRGNFIMSSSKSNNLYEYNEVRNSPCYYDDGCIQIYNSTSTVRYNVFNNVSVLDDYEGVIGIRRTDPTQHVVSALVHDNTFIGTPVPAGLRNTAVVVHNGGIIGSVIVKNNIFKDYTSNGSHVDEAAIRILDGCPSTLQVNWNDYYNYRNTVYNGLGCTLSSPNDIVGNPQLDAQLVPATGSPVCGAGENGTDIGAKDCPVGPSNTIHVGVSGTDNASCGSSSAQCRTIQYAVNKMTAGQTVLVHAGTYSGSPPGSGPNGLVVLDSRIGSTSTSRFTIKAAPGETVVLDGDDVNPGNPLGCAIGVNSTSFVTVEGFIVQDFVGCVVSSGDPAHINFFNSIQGEVLNNTVTVTKGATDAAGIGYQTNTYATPKTGKVSGNTVQTDFTVGINYSTTGNAMLNDNGEISNNTVRMMKDPSTGPVPRVYGIVMRRMDRVKILNNTVLDLGTPVDSRIPNSAAFYIRDQEGLYMAGNISSGFPWGFYSQDTATVGSSPTNRGYLNTFEQSTIVNNTFDGPEPYSNTSYASLNTGGACDGCIVKNNLFTSFDFGLSVMGNTIVGDPCCSTQANSTNYITSVSNNLHYNINNLYGGTSLMDLIGGNIRNDGQNTETLTNPVKDASNAKPLPYYELYNTPSVSPAINYGLLSACAWSPSDGLCDAGAFELGGIGPPVNSPPNVNAGPDAIGTTGQNIVLNGTASDNTQVVSLNWVISSTNCTITQGPFTPSGSTTRTATINCSLPGTYSATLTAFDNGSPSLSASDSATITANNPTGTNTVVLQDGLNGYSGTKDNQMTATGANGNSGANSSYYTGTAGATGTEDQRILLSFDVSQAASGIPSNAQVQSATIELYLLFNQVTTTNPTNAYILLRNWGEGIGTNNFTTPAQTGESSWNSYQFNCGGCSNSGNWSAGGANGTGTDRGSTSIGSRTFSSSESTGTFKSISLDSATVQNWISNPSTNFGMVLIGTETGTANERSNFASSENATVTQRPRLTITYTTPSGGNTAPIVTVSSIATGTVGQPVSLNGSATDNSAVTGFTWSANSANCSIGTASNSGLGTAIASSIASMTCSVAGTYSVTLSATDNGTPQLTGSNSANATINASGTSPVLAGLEGFGSSTTGGEDCSGVPCPIVYVTSLADSGAGSLRSIIGSGALSNRRVHFQVCGNIDLSTNPVTGKLRVDGMQNVTIDGATAPTNASCQGITIRFNQMEVRNSTNLIIRHLRIRDSSATNQNGGTPGLSVYTPNNNMWIDHVSVSGSNDESLTVYQGGQNITISNSLIANVATAPAGTNPALTGKGGLIGDNASVPTQVTSNISLHHNIYSNTDQRNPQVSGIYLVHSPVVDMRNNIVHNWGSAGYGTRDRNSATGNIVNNIYVPIQNVNDAIILDRAGVEYVNGNIQYLGRAPAGNPTVTLLNGSTISSTPVAAPAITQHTTTQLPNLLLDSTNGVGALPRDAYDATVIATISTDMGIAAVVLPTISNIQVPPASMTSNSATINWTTNVNATSEVEYGTTTSYGFMQTSANGTTHSVTITGLSPGVTYHFRVKSQAV